MKAADIINSYLVIKYENNRDGLYKFLWIKKSMQLNDKNLLTKICLQEMMNEQ